ncbi:MAG: hypothetical protein QXG00_00125 [Candidatus Woesearchaeota archaeon]
MKVKNNYIWLFIIFTLTLSARLFFAFQTEYFDRGAYFTVRQVEHIRQTGLPLFNDTLSSNLRVYSLEPFFYYLLAGFTFFMPFNIALKIIPNVCASLLVVFVYFLCMNLTKNSKASLFSALIAGFIPGFFVNYNSLSVNILLMPLIVLLFFFYSKEDVAKNVYYIVAVFILIVITSPMSVVLAIGFLLYFILLKVERTNFQIFELEIVLFFSMLVIWINSLIYNNALLMHGFKIVLQNIPKKIIQNYFSEITFSQAIYYIGILPLILGLLGIYYSLKLKKKNTFPVISLFLVFFILLWFRLINLFTGIVGMGILLSVMASISIGTGIDVFLKTKFSKYFSFAIILFIVFIIIFLLLPSFFLSFNQINFPSNKQISSLNWIRNNTNNNTVILGDPSEGYLINYFAQRKTIMDYNFLSIDNIDARYSDLELLYQSRFESEADKRMRQYGIDYIYLSEQTMAKYNQSLIYYAEPPCYELVYNQSEKIYRFLCKQK